MKARAERMLGNMNDVCVSLKVSLTLSIVCLGHPQPCRSRSYLKRLFYKRLNYLTLAADGFESAGKVLLECTTKRCISQNKVRTSLIELTPGLKCR